VRRMRDAGHTSGHRWVSLLGAGLICAVLVAGIVTGESAALRAEAQHSSALARHRAAEQALLLRVSVRESAVQSVAAPRVVARELLDLSAGRVLDESERETLASVITHADTLVAELTADADRGRRALAAGGTRNAGRLTPHDIAAAEELLALTAQADPSALAAVRERLQSQITIVTDAVAAWQVEQDRLAAEAAARAAAAAAAAAEAAAAQAAAEARNRANAAAVASPSRSGQANPGSAPAAPAGGGGAPAASAAPAPVVHNEYVWTTGFQAELDACKGSVNMAPSFGTGVIGEHWSCGGSSFPKAEGATVVLSGVLSGTFRVGPVVAVLNKHVDRIEDVPQGYELLYQTCINGDNTRMSFTQLIRVS
jgi:hypothetical protein